MFVATDKAFKTWEYGVVASFFTVSLIYTINAIRKL
jgi:hypothetical protein